MAFWNWAVGKPFTPANLNAFKSAYKSGTEDRASTTLVIDSELQFAIGANETWAFTFNLISQGTATTDVKYSLGFPSGAVSPWAVIGGGSASVTAFTSNGFDTPTSASSTRAVGMDGSVYLSSLTGTVFNGATAGSVALYWATNATDGSNTASVRKGSHLIATRLD
jgi:hypothetical protein